MLCNNDIGLKYAEGWGEGLMKHGESALGSTFHLVGLMAVLLHG